jgi:hypothetical protein
MKLLTRSLVAALALAFGSGGVVFAYEGATVMAANNNNLYAGGGSAPSGDCGCAAPCGSCLDGCGDCCGCNACDSCCDPEWGFFSEAELLFLRYHRADGVRIGSDAGEAGETDFNPAYRFTLGTVAPNGVGFRTRYFAYDHFESIEDAGDGIYIDTYTIDFELFEAFALNRNWAMEISGGVRYANFQEEMVDNAAGDYRSNGFNGAGLITGLEARRAVGFGLLYARTRLAVVQDDKNVVNIDGNVPLQNVTLIDTTGGMVELAVGGEVNYQLGNGAVFFARSGLEWQNWWNFSSNFTPVDPPLGVLGESIFTGASDIGFGGFTLSMGVSY